MLSIPGNDCTLIKTFGKPSFPFQILNVLPTLNQCCIHKIYEID